ncbi:L-threonylcarbamoyladenylate synthase, partial [Roseisolibacter sp. H3M3-2]|uniref:L-threonylcarbamoyladenylate synthase n=1 Tax=Roseisolibacter sp. H3M3-2 TaxID=3031323 RepID=UPI0023DBF025
MPIRSVDPAAPDPAVLAEAAAVLRAGGLVAFPTETVYGLGAHALDADAVRRIFAAKGRPSYNPLIAHAADADGARALAAAWPDAAERLAAAFWPGPLTLVLPKRPHVPDALTAGLPAVAVRVPAHPVALALLRAAALPVAAPSANRFTELSPTTAAHVAKALGDRVDLIVDGGPAGVGIESTVVDLTGARPALLRPGPLGAEAIGAVLGETPTPGAVPDRVDAPRAAPGMVERHYAPRAEVWPVEAGAREGAR